MKTLGIPTKDLTKYSESRTKMLIEERLQKAGFDLDKPVWSQSDDSGANVIFEQAEDEDNKSDIVD